MPRLNLENLWTREELHGLRVYGGWAPRTTCRQTAIEVLVSMSLLRGITRNVRVSYQFSGAISASKVRQFGTSHENVEVKEVEIPVPWGKIAARHWNPDPSLMPVLCVHGWKDNAASFDTLLPLLVKEVPQYQFLAIDIPGHGRSSHFPPGMVYTMPDMWLMYKRILRHFDWNTVRIISHSMGAQFSFMFTGTHPNIVDKMVAIDALSPVVLTKEDAINLIPKITEDILGFEEKLLKGQRPTYTYDEIVHKLLTTHVGGMDAESCKVLMTRGVEEYPPDSGRFRFTHDIRVHYMPIQGLTSRQVAYVMENFRSDILRIKASDGVKYTQQFIKENMQTWLAYDTARRPKGNIVRFVTVEGKHHLHLIDPHSVLPHIARFLSEDRYVMYDGS